MKSFYPLLLAIQFLTQIPVRLKQPYGECEVGASLLYYPLVGLLLGALLAGLHAMLHGVPALLHADYATPDGRRRHGDELAQTLHALFRTKTAAEWMALFQRQLTHLDTFGCNQGLPRVVGSFGQFVGPRLKAKPVDDKQA